MKSVTFPFLLSIPAFEIVVNFLSVFYKLYMQFANEYKTLARILNMLS